MEKTSIISIRVYEDEKKILLEESAKNNLTINSLGRQIILKHVAWHRYSKDMGYTCIPKSLVKTLFTDKDGKTMRSISTDVSNTIKNTILFIYGEITLSNVLAVLDIWFNACNISFRHFTDFHIEKYVITHKMGERFSTYLDLSLNSVLNEIGYSIINKIIEEERITFEICRDDNA